MKQFKFNLLAIIGMMVAVATFAFTTPANNLATTHWFSVNENQEITEYLGSDAIGETELATLDCELTDPQPEVCGIQLLDSQVNPDGPNSFKPKAGIDIDSPGANRVYKDPMSN